MGRSLFVFSVPGMVQIKTGCSVCSCEAGREGGERGRDSPESFSPSLELKLQNKIRVPQTPQRYTFEAQLAFYYKLAFSPCPIQTIQPLRD